MSPGSLPGEGGAVDLYGCRPTRDHEGTVSAELGVPFGLFCRSSRLPESRAGAFCKRVARRPC